MGIDAKFWQYCDRVQLCVQGVFRTKWTNLIRLLACTYSVGYTKVFYIIIVVVMGRERSPDDHQGTHCVATSVDMQEK